MRKRQRQLAAGISLPKTVPSVGPAGRPAETNRRSLIGRGARPRAANQRRPKRNDNEWNRITNGR